ncbi:asparagine synthase (glutamine-hydrolyzing) [Thermosulfurimonas sp. F29]|uniref:asparagine synthase (glutamine-hydrolyzing) n=1 Tax=Thermosulfurimonas sp. F29 TaxID=2867247 RepID=UPI001C83B4CB|nr:asparagine synthase (glutamine-hydrolyzing) [Thermosulfurimonas sp. F29]MBX6423452.1 asparagine synthase (glutamine-hydrolyzing) [Thermosulfurimonas sp. F29]
MCGITGFWIKYAGKGDERGRLAQMNASLTHRGPDEDGFFTEGPVGLANRRLSILDLEGGRQPVFNEDSSVVVVYNGEIYNYPQLRTELEAKGHRFATRTDTEVLVHLYEEEGPDFVKRLRGMFAFALYDQRKQELLLARDSFGIKPLVYAELPEGFFFASELKALLSLPFFPREVDGEAVAFYAAFNYIPAPWTVWKAARRLPPGYLMRVRKGKVVELRSYVEWPREPAPSSIEEAVERLEETLKDSVRGHLISDVPVGAFLSGGLDSSLVCALAQRELSGPLRTFTIAFPEWPTYDEARYARKVAEYLGTQHEEIPVTAREAREIMWEVLEHLDEPFADSSLVNVGLISKMAGRRVKVVLSGDGGDEFFAGYNKYQGLALVERLYPWRGLFMPLKWLPFPERRGSRVGERLRQVRKLLRLLRPEAFERYLRATMATEPETVDGLLRDDFSGPLSVCSKALYRVWKESEERYPEDRINTWLRADAHWVLPYDMLHKVDTASMQYSLEVRVPLVDVRVARMAFSLPGKWKLRGLTRKWILRKVADKYLPEEILERPKGGFGIPLGEWMRGELREVFEEYFSSSGLSESVWKPEGVRKLWGEHLSRRRDRFWELWNVFVFEVWRRRWRPMF